MKNSSRKLLFATSGILLLLFILFIVNQTAQVVDLASRVNTTLGTVVLWTLIAVYALLFIVPIVYLLALPRSLRPPASEASQRYPAYLKALGKRLSSHPKLGSAELMTRDQIEQAMNVLDSESNDIIKNAAAAVFLSTAVSQSGRLDAFLVLAAQTRMVMRVARVYNQRPTLRDLTRLYANVAATTFVAGELDDIDVSQQIQPILSATLGTLAVTVPGMQLATSILVNSVLTGAANAFLTLRVGIIARRYCGSLVTPEKKDLRKAAGAEAAKLLGSIVRQGASTVSKAIWDAAKSKASDTVTGVTDYAKSAGKSFLNKVGLQKRKEKVP
jgi:hypothetical protein